MTNRLAVHSACRNVLAVTASLIAASANAQAGDVMRLEASGPEVVIELDGVRLGQWALDLKEYPKNLPLPVEKTDATEICFVQNDRRACADFLPGQSRALEVTFGGGLISTMIEARRSTPPAVFDAAYQAAHRGRTVVEVPEVYELVNIVIAVTPFGRGDADMVYHDSDYYRAVQKHFAPFADHPLIARVDAMLRESRSNYFPFKMNGYAFVFNDQGDVVQSPVYDRTGYAGSFDNAVRPYLADLNAFAKVSNFRAFYQENLPLYERQTRFFEEEAEVSRISTWLQERFPSVAPYDGVKTIFSPLVAYNQSLTTIEADGYRELQPHINYVYWASRGLSPEGAAVERTATLFTEMNHGFINPVSRRYSERIAAALSDRATWADDARAAGSYRSAESLFNEYMNWALFSLYRRDLMSAEDFAISHPGTVRNMQDGRGFKRFSDFDTELLRLYSERTKGQTIEDLYPAIIAWFEKPGSALPPTR